MSQYAHELLRRLAEDLEAAEAAGTLPVSPPAAAVDAEIEQLLADSDGADDFEADDLNGTDDWEWEP